MTARATIGKQMIEDSSGMSTGVGSRDTVGLCGRRIGVGSVLEGGSAVLEAIVVVVLVPGGSRRVLPMWFALQLDAVRMTSDDA